MLTLPKSAIAVLKEKAETGTQAALEVLWTPHPDNKPQQEAYYSQADRLYFGGAAGCGKSSLLVGLALTQHKNSIIFRREYPQLKGVVDESKKIIAGRGRYNSQDKVWNNLPGGIQLEFGAVQREEDVEKFQGRAHSYLGFDELCHFTRSQFVFLCGWNRSTDPDERCRVVAAGNPPTTPEGQWVVEYWAPWLDKTHELYPHPHGELIWYVTIGEEDKIVQVGGDRPGAVQIDDKQIVPHSRTFIPGRLKDNPYLSQTNYLSTLYALPETLQRIFIDGEFGIESEDDEWQVIPSLWVERAFERWENSCPLPSNLTSMGVDVARGGKDQTIIAMRRGYWFEELLKYSGTTTPDGGTVSAQVAKHWADDCSINIDVIGVGTSVYDILKDTYPNVNAIGGGEKSIKSDRSGKLAFYNKRAELLWMLREALDPEVGENICLPRDTRLKSELCAARWKLVPPAAGDLSKKGRIQVESKDDIKDRLGRSPDLADALCYCWANQNTEFEPIQYNLDVRDIAPKMPEVQVQHSFSRSRPKRSRSGWR